jgi:hypothetical protein
MPAFLLTLLRPSNIAYAALSAVLVFGTYYVVHRWNKGAAAIVEARELRAQVVALEQSAQLVGGVMAEAEGKVEAVDDIAAKVRIIYREAVRTDPDCAEWARQPIACPLGGE